MIYTGTFKDINDNSYSVKLTTSGSGNTSITLGTPPFTTSIECSESHLYKPCKYSSATVKMIGSDYLFNLYSPTAQGVKVELFDSGNTCKWIGYLTPNLYSQDYENTEFEVDLEAQDALSTLQYYDYTTIGATKDIVSLLAIINKLLTKCNAYNRFFISDNIQKLSTNNECLLSKMYISEQNFFDEDDEAMTMQEVLEEICRYIGVTCIADGKDIYFIDYDAIKNGINTYWRYNVGSTSGTKVTVSQSKAIDGSDYSENGGMLSLDNVYNKAVVKDRLYTFDSIIPSIWDDKYLTNYGTVQEVNETFKDDKYKCFFKYYSHSNYKSYYYNKSTLAAVSAPTTVNYAYTQNYVGATIVRHQSEKVDDFNAKFNKINYTDYVLLHCHNTYDNTLRKMFELEVNDSTASFIGGSTYLIIKGNFRYLDREGEMYVIEGYSNKDDNFNASELYITCKLQYGNKYWNGSSWSTTESTFNLYFDSNGQTDHCINQVFPIKNNITYNMGLDAEGYAIPMPTSYVTTGKPLFTLYQPHQLDPHYRCDAVWLSDFDIIAKVQNFEEDEEKDSDTEYSNVIDSDFTEEMEDEEFKICTWDNKEANFSCVCYYDGTNYQFIDRVYSKSLGQLHRFEEHFIYKLVNQYSTPSAILQINLKNEYNVYCTFTDKWLSGKIFIIDSIETDYEADRQTLRLIEKK